MRKPASREIISASVELCGTEVCFLHRTYWHERVTPEYAQESVFGAESATRQDALQRASALGLLRRLLAMDVVDAEGLDHGEEGVRSNYVGTDGKGHLTTT